MKRVPVVRTGTLNFFISLSSPTGPLQGAFVLQRKDLQRIELECNGKTKGLQWNLALRPPRYYGHFFLAARQNDHTFSCKKKPR